MSRKAGALCDTHHNPHEEHEILHEVAVRDMPSLQLRPVTTALTRLPSISPLNLVFCIR